MFRYVKFYSKSVAVYGEEPFCLENGNFSMKCPENHYLIIKEASHKVVKTGPCPTDLSSGDTCTLSDLTEGVTNICWIRNSCTVSVSDSSTACSGYTGNKFVTVTYKCEPGRQSGNFPCRLFADDWDDINTF